jgi:hypothetical protein
MKVVVPCPRKIYTNFPEVIKSCILMLRILVKVFSSAVSFEEFNLNLKCKDFT